MKKISIEEHQRLMHDLHCKTKEGVYREMDYLVRDYEGKVSFWKFISAGLFITVLTLYLL